MISVGTSFVMSVFLDKVCFVRFLGQGLLCPFYWTRFLMSVFLETASDVSFLETVSPFLMSVFFGQGFFLKGLLPHSAQRKDPS